MFLTLYVYVIAFVLNYINLYKGSSKYSLFFIFKDLITIVIFNLIFYILVSIFNIDFKDVKNIVFICLISIFLYFIKKKYICFSFSGGLFYIVCRILKIEVNLQEILFLVGSLHFIEGLFIFSSYFFNKEKLKEKIYLPLVLGGIPIIFMISYGRYDYKNYRKLVSGLVIFLYGIIILIISLFNDSYLLVFLMVLLHELIFVFENLLLDKYVKLS